MSGNNSPVHKNAKNLFSFIRCILGSAKRRVGHGLQKLPGCDHCGALLAWGLTLLLVVVNAATGLASPPAPGALPTGGQIVSGSGSISTAPSGSSMTVKQNNSTMVINWNTFNIGRNASVQFVQPSSSSSALNRIFGQNPSQIFGALKSNGLIYLIDPSGIIFGATAQVDVGGLVAASLDLSDSNYLASNFKFTSTGPRGGVVNQGSINAAKYGVVALIAPQVSNEGTISAPAGSVALAGANRVTLDFAGDGLLKLSVDKSALDTEVKNGAAAKTSAGGVAMTPKAEQHVESTVVNNSGIIEADSIKSKNGAIILDGGESGTVTNSGAIAARGDKAGETGGTVTVTGKRVALVSGGSIDASGSAGGGAVNVGGGPHGADGAIGDSDEVSMDAGASIRADATGSGNGGRVTLWSQKKTNFAGTISARGGPHGGNGGTVETSSLNSVSASGKVDTSAPLGITGLWLLDPADIVIAQSGGTITPATIESNLATTNFTLDTNATGGSARGNITVSSAITWSSVNTLSLLANSSIAVNAAITGTGGGNLVLRADSQGTGSGTVSFGTGGSVSLTGGTGGGNNAAIFYNPASNGTTYAKPTDYSGFAAAGNLTAYMLVNNVNDLQNMSENLAGDYALGTNIDASPTSKWNAISGGGYAGFTPIGTWSTPFTGIFNGNGQTINGLYINLSNADYAGLFGYTKDATLENVTIANGSVNGGYYVGSLAGEADGSTVVANASNSGTSVTGSEYAGGLVGNIMNGGQASITNGVNSGTVNGEYDAGGLVGGCSTTLVISNSSNSGSVFGYGSVGGLVGNSSGPLTIVSSFNTGPVTGSQNASYYMGGLAGFMENGSLSSSYNTGAVSGNGSYSYDIGGLAGYAQDTAITNCHNGATGSVSGSGDSIGGLVGVLAGVNGKSSIDSSYNLASVSGGYYTGGLVGDVSYEGAGNTTGVSESVTNSQNGGSVTGTGSYVGGIAGSMRGNQNANVLIDKCSNTGQISGVSDVGGVVGDFYAETGGSAMLSNSYNTGTVTGSGSTIGGVAGQITVDAGGWATVKNSYNTNTVTGTGSGSDIGGVVGEVYSSGGAATVTDSYNSGQVSGTSSGSDYVGGVVGGLWAYGYNSIHGMASVTASYNTGPVSGGWYVGGVAGYVGSGGSVWGSYNTNSVTGSYYVGGVAGEDYGLVSNAYNLGPVQGTDYVGGIAGWGDGTLVYSYNGGSVTVTGEGDTGIGGVTSYATGDISTDYYDNSAQISLPTGPVTPWDSAQGVVSSRMQALMSARGWDFTNTWAANPTGPYPTLKWQQGGYVTVSGDISGSSFSSLGGDIVQLVLNGNGLGQATTAANGFYALTLPSASVASGGDILALVPGAGTPGATVLPSDGSSVSGLTIWSNTLLSGPGESVSGILAATGGYPGNNTYSKSGGDTIVLGANLNLVASDLDLNGNITTSGTGSQTYSRPVTLSTDASLTSDTGAITFSGVVSDGGSGHNLTIDTNGQVTQAYSISLAGLALVGNGADFELTNSQNNVSTLAANITDAGGNPNGTVSFTNTGDLTIGQVNGTNGLTASNVNVSSQSGTLWVESPVNGGPRGAITLYGSSGINLDATISTGTLVLQSYGTVNQNGGENNAITATGLELSSYGDFELTNSSNKVGTIAANVGTLNFRNSGDITVGQVNTTNGISAFSALGLYAAGNISVNSPITGYDVTLRADSQGTGTGTVKFGASGLVNAPYGEVSIYYNPASNGATFASPTNYSGYVTAGTLTSYVLVNNVSDLQNMNMNLAGDYALGTNIDASATSNWNPVAAGGYAGFTPIGAQATPFTGIFNGNGQTIANLTINLPGSDYVGLFGYASGAALSNVSLSGGSVTGGQYVGGLVGEADGTTIADCFNSGMGVSGQNYLGGLEGFASSGTVKSSGNSGSIAGAQDTGGIVGYARNATMDTSINTGAINGVANTGGLIGYAQDTTVTQSTNGSSTDPTLGAVSGKGDSTGGLVGQLVGSTTTAVVNSSNNYGPVTGATDTGGLIGSMSGVGEYLYQSINHGTVTGSGTMTGGLVGGMVAGASESAIITESSNSGAVTGGAETGGLAGYSSGSILYSFNTGGVSGAGDYTGGLAGRVYSSGQVTSSYNSGAVSGGGDYVGGVAGYVSGVIYDTANLGSVRGGGDVGGLAGYIDAYGYLAYSYSIGRLSSTGAVNANVGGVAGAAAPGAYISTDYFDTTTSGLTNTWDSAQGLADMQMAQQASFAGWDFYSTWAIQEGQTYPYLQWSSSWGGPKSQTTITISGLLSGLANLGNDLIDFAVDGTIVGDCYTLANGAFTLNLSSSAVSSGESILAFLAGASSPGASVSISNGGSMSGLSITANTLLTGSGESVSGILSAKGGLTNSDIPYTASGANLVLANNINLVASDLKLDGNITTSGTGAQTFNGALTLSGGSMLTSPGGISFNGGINGAGGNLTINSNGPVSEAQTGAITAAGLELLGTGGNYQLTNGANSITTIAANTGTLNFSNSGNLTIGTVGTTTGITTTSATTIQAGGDIVLDSAISANGIILAASKNFISNVSANPLNPGGGDWLIYSTDPRLDTLNGLTPGFIQYDASYPSTPAANGNGLLYSLAPVIDVSLQGVVQKTYDATPTASLSAGDFTQSGAVNGDLVNLNLPVSGLYSDKNAGTGKQVSVSGLGILSASNNGIPVYGYQLASGSVAAHIGTITPAALTIAAVSDTKTYDGTVLSNGLPTVSGLQAGDQASGLAQAFDSSQVGARTLSVSGYDILDGNNGQNYAVTLETASGQITAAVQPQNYVPSIAGNLIASQQVLDTSTGVAQTANGTSSMSGGTGPATQAQVETEAAPVGGVASGQSVISGIQSGTEATTALIQNATESQSKGDFSDAARDFRNAAVNMLDQGSVPQARQAIELMETAELEDYYQDSSIGRPKDRGTFLKDLPAGVAVLYTMISPHRLDLIVCFRSGLKRFSIPIEASALSRDIVSFRVNLQRRTSWGYMAQARKLYTVIVKPIERELTIRGIDTLVIIPDGALRTVPFAALNDGSRFLIEKYGLAITPSLSLTDAGAVLPKDARALAAGLSKSVQGFAALPNVEGELSGVHSLYNSDLIENVGFVSENVQKGLAGNRYSIVHIATHGNFGPKGQDTFLLTWDSKIDMNRLEGIMKQSKQRVGLLCLSACETAAGDDRAALGLAGVAVKAGAQSALATLWNVSDQAAPLLIHEFYDELKAPSVSKAQALQQAQLKLMDDPRFSHPYYWSPFLLIGNWR